MTASRDIKYTSVSGNNGIIKKVLSLIVLYDDISNRMIIFFIDDHGNRLECFVLCVFCFGNPEYPFMVLRKVNSFSNVLLLETQREGYYGLLNPNKKVKKNKEKKCFRYYPKLKVLE